MESHLPPYPLAETTDINKETKPENIDKQKRKGKKWYTETEQRKSFEREILRFWFLWLHARATIYKSYQDFFCYKTN